MTQQFKPIKVYKFFITLIIMVLFVSVAVSPALAHGPKGHGGDAFTTLQAAKKGIELYDRLVDSRKLAEPWGTDLTDIEVFKRIRNNKREFVVKFNRSKGDPRTAYIFFNAKGEYSGSNFTGE